MHSGYVGGDHLCQVSPTLLRQPCSCERGLSVATKPDSDVKRIVVSSDPCRSLAKTYPGHRCSYRKY
ncbi:hypothetical protein DPMN_154433 [Dreissena polymorpha]|uniref:Uncharacterized protein n=1 Tax=Dreissena polymorpha TaxID=45954 RepID=A0A9D4FQS3_DREPO|nr:hypothetical protein DPMN_154433 [Dreissena polymorpha]